MKWQLVTLVLCVCASGAGKGRRPAFPKGRGRPCPLSGGRSSRGRHRRRPVRPSAVLGCEGVREAKNVIQLEDPTLGRLVLKGVVPEAYGGTTGVWFHFTLTIEAKDGRFRWTLDQLEYCGGGVTNCEALQRELTKDGIGVFGRKAVFERFRKDLLAIATQLEAAMATPGEQGKSDKW